ncbi:MAG: hypothetical protein M3O03_01420 [Pseudomonadota bacterium]|nr:hypothetical protein [Pseudomonadota bacterium]
MKHLLIAAALCTTLFAIPAFADDQLDLANVEAQLQTAHLDANAAAIVQGLETSADTAASKNDSFDVTLDINQLKKYMPTHSHMMR